jgi:hypothetical protein
VVPIRPPLWGGLFVTALSGGATFYTFTVARDEYRATQLRMLRGSPKPGTSGRVDINLLELGRKHPDEPDTPQ